MDIVPAFSVVRRRRQAKRLSTYSFGRFGNPRIPVLMGCRQAHV